MAGISSFINRLNVVKQIPIFSKLNWFDVQKIARKAVLVDYKKGEIVSKEGSPPDYFYCLISGRIQVYSFTPTGKKENVDFIHRGTPFGIISLLTGEDHSLTCEAINDSVILKIEKDDFKKILTEIPQLGIEFSHTLSTRIRRNIKGTKSIFESKVISVYSPVSGTGSSTYAINLAMSLKKETKKKVAFVDLHFGKKEGDQERKVNHTEPLWKVEPVQLCDIVDDYEKIHDTIIEGELGIDLLNVVFEAESELLKNQIGSFVSSFAGHYHYIVVDLPSNMDETVLETLTQSDLVHLITSDRRKDLEQIRHVINRLEDNLRDRFMEQKIKVIIRAVHDKIYLSFEEIDKFIDFSVYKMLPKIHQEQLTRKIDSVHLSLTACDQTSEYAKVVTRIAREIGHVLVGLALGGGAALGLAHVGVIRVMEKENIPVDVVVGSSMGALIAGLWVNGKNADELEKIAREFKKTTGLLKLFDPVVPISGLIGGRFIKRWLKKHLGNSTFYSSRIPLKIVAYDLKRREEIVINGGTIVDAIRKSIAIPGVIEPILEKDQMIIDGGVLNPLPTNVLASLGIKKIIAVNVLQSPEDVSQGHDISRQKYLEEMEMPFLKAPFKFLGLRIKCCLSKPFTPNISDIIVRTLQASEHVIAEQSAQQADVTIHPDLVGVDWYELHRVDEIVKSGEDAARVVLPQIKKLLEE